MNNLRLISAALMLSAATMACKSKNKTETPVGKDSTVNAPVATVIDEDMPKSPIINIEDTLIAKGTYICVKDSAATVDAVGKKFSFIFDSTLGKIIKTNKLTVKGHPAAWFSKLEAPFFFEVGLPVDKAPVKQSKNILVKNIGGDSALVAHFFGPYEMTGQAYEALKERLKEEKPRKKAGKPYEVYVDDPLDEKGNPKNPFKVKTAVILPYN